MKNSNFRILFNFTNSSRSYETCYIDFYTIVKGPRFYTLLHVQRSCRCESIYSRLSDRIRAHGYISENYVLNL